MPQPRRRSFPHRTVGLPALRRRAVGVAGSRQRDRGANPVELAILMPAILILLLASIQAAAWFIARATALNAAQSAVSAQRVYQAEPGIGEQRAEDFLDRAGDWLVGWEVAVTVPEPDDTQVSATVTGEPLRIMPFISLPAISETAFGTVERFTEEDPP
jgi:TadE-like protein